LSAGRQSGLRASCFGGEFPNGLRNVHGIGFLTRDHAAGLLSLISGRGSIAVAFLQTALVCSYFEKKP